MDKGKLAAQLYLHTIQEFACNVRGIMTECSIGIKQMGQRRDNTMKNGLHFLEKLHLQTHQSEDIDSHPKKIQIEIT